MNIENTQKLSLGHATKNGEDAGGLKINLSH
jgi:hypothetical protein